MKKYNDDGIQKTTATEPKVTVAGKNPTVWQYDGVNAPKKSETVWFVVNVAPSISMDLADNKPIIIIHELREMVSERLTICVVIQF